MRISKFSEYQQQLLGGYRKCSSLSQEDGQGDGVTEATEASEGVGKGRE